MTITMIDASMVAGMLMTSYCIMMSANQPGRVNLVVLTERTPQSVVRAEIGNPVWFGKNDEGLDVDIFQFTQGYSGPARAARPAWQVVAEVDTLGLLEFIGFAIEKKYSGTKMNVFVTYDEQQKVKLVKLEDNEGNAIRMEEKQE